MSPLRLGCPRLLVAILAGSLAVSACAFPQGINHPRRGHADARERIAELEAELEELRAGGEVRDSSGGSADTDLERLRGEKRKLARECERLRGHLARAADLYSAEERQRADRLQREVEQLRQDLAEAERTFVAIESGLRGSYSRAEAVSQLAEARVVVARAAELESVDLERVAEAQAKLEDADRQLKRRNMGSSIFFSSRARRIAETLLVEAGVARSSH